VLAQTKKFSAIICLGCVVRGDTPHFDYVAGEAARGFQRGRARRRLPVIFGVLTTNTEERPRPRRRLPQPRRRKRRRGGAGDDAMIRKGIGEWWLLVIEGLSGVWGI
jgi:6,7-dimethyl-8-ribityllumazine synthase